jgi:hypothetical protein
MLISRRADKASLYREGAHMTTDRALIDPPAPDLRPALKQLSVANSTDTIILVNPDVGPTDRPFRNLVRRDAQKMVVWTAELPEPEAINRYDCYVEVRWANERLAANTWQGEYVLLDPDTGRIESREFVK